MHIRKWGQGELMRFCYCGKDRAKGICGQIGFCPKEEKRFLTDSHSWSDPTANVQKIVE